STSSLISAPLPTSHLSFSLFHDTPTTEIYTLSLHDALPISRPAAVRPAGTREPDPGGPGRRGNPAESRGRRDRGGELHRDAGARSEEHTSELQSLTNLVCRLLLEKKKTKKQLSYTHKHDPKRCPDTEKTQKHTQQDG